MPDVSRDFARAALFKALSTTTVHDGQIDGISADILTDRIEAMIDAKILALLQRIGTEGSMVRVLIAMEKGQ